MDFKNIYHYRVPDRETETEKRGDCQSDKERKGIFDTNREDRRRLQKEGTWSSQRFGHLSRQKWGMCTFAKSVENSQMPSVLKYKVSGKQWPLF